MSLEQALRQAGMNEEQYRNRLGALTMARNDAAGPSAIDAEAKGFNYEGPMDPDMKKTLEGMKAFYETRRQNAILYKRHAAAPDPLLSALGQWGRPVNRSRGQSLVVRRGSPRRISFCHGWRNLFPVSGAVPPGL